MERVSLVSRPQKDSETANISDPVPQETRYSDPGGEEVRDPFLRTRERVPVRRRRGSRLATRFGWNNRWMRVAFLLLAVVVVGLLAGAAWEVKSFLLHNPRFRLNSTESVQVTGNRVVSADQVRALFASDADQSILRVPLKKRQAQLEEILWVRRATVMRLWPNRLRVHIVERSPVAFVREGNSIHLIDGDGVLLALPNAAAQHYSFPILGGISANEPLSARAAQVEQYREFAQALDSRGGNISATLSEVDLSDPEDVRAIFTGGSRHPLVHFGATDFLPRYQAYRAHLDEWLRQYPQLRSIDMRYGRQVVLDTGTVPEVAASKTNVPPQPTQRAAVKPAIPASSSAPSHRGKQAVAHTRVERSATKKHRAPARKSKQTPERGHHVFHPLMHVVRGA